MIEHIKEDSNNIIIKFEPLLEGKIDIASILELFYLKLLCLVKDEGFKNVIKKSLKSMALLARFKVTGKVQIPFSAVSIDLEKDVGKDIDDIINLWEEEGKRILFTSQSEEINKQLIKNKYKVYVIIDEVDRLTAEVIINFLLFCRTLELFDQIVCIIGMDYSRVIKKLISEGYLGLSDYDSAKSYVDKLFQKEFKIYINESQKMKFMQDQLKLIDADHVFDFIYNKERVNDHEEMKKISTYLSTPRALKKFLITVKYHYPLVKYCDNRTSLLQFLAVTITHSLILENFSKYTSKLIQVGISWRNVLKDSYGIDAFTADDSIGKFLLSSLGVKDSKFKDDRKFMKLYDQIPLKIENIDQQTINFCKNFLSNVPNYIKCLLLEGYIDDNQVSAYHDFFHGDVNLTLEKLLKSEGYADILASDLSDALKYFSDRLKTSPSIDILNTLWRNKREYSFGDSYHDILLFCMVHGFDSFDKLVDEADISMSEALITHCLSKVGINNQRGQYDLNRYKKIGNNDSMHKNIPLYKKLSSKSEVERVLKLWLKKVKVTLEDKESSWWEQPNLISVFYRYIQFGFAVDVDIDNRDTLSEIFVAFLNDEKVSALDKKSIIEIITKECEAYQDGWRGDKQSKTPLEMLFNNNSELIDFIEEFNSKQSVCHFYSFKETSLGTVDLT